ncbi:unnamed protein product [Linum tenue]|uniref:Pentatricopeptide repeat-containing protein n=1 Tax=Linum tenue TaxID=586396 RepID=A0AAV0LG67_9ROSI|nr:unnamed protein product [Linum tenue]
MGHFSCSPNVVTFTSLIDGYCRSGQVNLGLKLWDVTRDINMLPNAYSFSIQINALCKENRHHEARRFLNELNSYNIVAHPFIYNPIIDGFCKVGNLDEANIIVEEMEMMFTILVVGHCMKGRMADAIGILNKMLTIGCAPDGITISSLTSCLLKAGMVSEAFQVKHMVVEDLNLGVGIRSVRFRPNQNYEYRVPEFSQTSNQIRTEL